MPETDQQHPSRTRRTLARNQQNIPLNGRPAALPAPWYMALSETRHGPVDQGWAPRLEVAMSGVGIAGGSGLPAAERARRYRTIGDLWESLGRHEAIPCLEHALAAYRLAVESDPAAAALDSTRVRRARAPRRWRRSRPHFGKSPRSGPLHDRRNA